ncbi:hypothetical protein H6G81_12105 [Scytonema hofmannii FACHB-248]|uniref:Bacteriocin n=1 Tax=Scytonema hofmannii FACHB-248 TaxID=1842502 RepID=A0ABR8GPV7_9CYAN|nr:MULTISPECIES: hypothetical protein [Nostocales]MBD2605257.1 hypothetical protein [Scytonema hofmannii FACHB-248]
MNNTKKVELQSTDLFQEVNDADLAVVTGGAEGSIGGANGSIGGANGSIGGANGSTGGLLGGLPIVGGLLGGL